MIVFLRAGLIASALALAITSGVAAKPHHGTDAIAGTWKLNTAASKGMVPPMKNDTRVYTVDGIKVTMRTDGIDATGKSVSSSYAAAYDGKFYPFVGNPVGDTIALTRVDSHTTTAILRKGSKVSATARAVVSQDGKHLTVTRKTGTPPGKLVTSTLAYDRM